MLLDSDLRSYGPTDCDNIDGEDHNYYKSLGIATATATTGTPFHFGV